MIRSTRLAPRPTRRGKGSRTLRPRVDALEPRALLSSFQLVKDVIPGPTGSNPYCLRTLGGSLLFSARTGPDTFALFASDGTPGGTTVIKPSGMSSPIRLPSYYSGISGSRYFFVATDSADQIPELAPKSSDGSHGYELWVTDGTEAGTHLANDTRPGPENGGGGRITADPETNAVFYIADDGNLPLSQVWRTDGTAMGTWKVTNIGDPDPPSGFGVRYGAGDGLTVASTGVYFMGSDSNVGQELYVTDGTAGGTRLVKDINPNAKARGVTFNGYLPWPELNGRLYFSANDSVAGWELWSTDGTEAGTRRETSINPQGDTEDPSGAPFTIVAYQGAIYFSAVGSDEGRELWKFEPGEGASLVKDINPGPNGSMTIGEPYGTKLYESQGLLYFVANDGAHGDQLWRSDGTREGTYMVKAIATPANAFAPVRGLTTFGDLLYFAANEATSGWELWQSDGTEAGTRIVEDFVPGTGSGIALDNYNEWITVMGDSLYFTANNADTGKEVYRYTPTADTLHVTPGEDLAGAARSPVSGVLAHVSCTGDISAADLIVQINWGDGTPTEAGTVTPDGAGGFAVSGTHTYSGAGDFPVVVSVQGPNASASQVEITARIATPVVPLTGRLDPLSDTGISDSDGITRDNTPTFHGTGTPGLQLRLLANGALVATTVIQPDGNWNVTVKAPLADGVYNFTAAALMLGVSRVPGPPPPSLPLGTIVIDTVGPVVTGLQFQPRTALINLTLRDERSGFASMTLANRAAYSVTRYQAPNPFDRRIEHITGVSCAVNPAMPTQPVTVSIRLDRGRPITHARFRFLARSARITDLAGNPLRGQFTGTFPTGRNNTAQDFQARLTFDGRRVGPVQPLVAPSVPTVILPTVKPRGLRCAWIR